MPDARESGGLRVAGRARAKEGKGGAVVVAGDHFWELGILDSERRAHVLGLGPVVTAIVRNGDLGVSVPVHVAEVDGVVRAGGHRGIAAVAVGIAVRNRLYGPGRSIVGGDHHAHSVDVVGIPTVVVGDVGGAVGRNSNVAVKAAARADPARNVRRTRHEGV